MKLVKDGSGEIGSVQEVALRRLRDLSDDLTEEDLIYRLYLNLKLRRAELNIQAGRILEDEEVEKRMAKWLLPADEPDRGRRPEELEEVFGELWVANPDEPGDTEEAVGDGKSGERARHLVLSTRETALGIVAGLGEDVSAHRLVTEVFLRLGARRDWIEGRESGSRDPEEVERFFARWLRDGDDDDASC